MSGRTSIVEALVEKFKTELNGTGPYTTNLYGNCKAVNKFWDEVNDYPYVCVVGGQEQREYLPSSFQWGFYSISIKLYVKKEEPQEELEQLISDIELVLKNTIVLTYGTLPGQETADIRITSIITDEGLLVPYGVGEINLIVQYQVL